MKIYGVGVSKGYAMAKARVIRKNRGDREPVFADDIENEKLRFEAALKIAKDELERLAKGARKVPNMDESAFELHQRLLGDPTIKSAVISKIERDYVCAEYALEVVGDELAPAFKSDMQVNSDDIKEALDRVLRLLRGRCGDFIERIDDECIVVAEELTPFEAVHLSNKSVRGFVTKKGSMTSHCSIIARQYCIPGVCGVELDGISDGDMLLLDGAEGCVTVSPAEADIAAFREAGRMEDRFEASKSRRCMTGDGVHIPVWCNVGCVSDLLRASESEVGGIGLLRSEFLFINKSTLPSEREQFEFYKSAAIRMKGRPVNIRTLDGGGDKVLPAFVTLREDNPVLGLRGVRLSLKYIDVFRTQLRAILAASAYGDARILLPMISSMEEFRLVKTVIDEAKKELDKKRVPYKKDISTGVMVEIPSCALIAGQLASEADFFSIGSNDLIQYTLAVDRSNDLVSDLYRPGHTAVLKLIKMTAQAANEAGISCAICGEMASDTEFVPILAGLGMTAFSVPLSCVLQVKEALNGYSMTECTDMAANILS